TDALDTSVAPTVVLPAAEDAADPIVLESEGEPAKVADDADPMSLDTLGDLPVLTDAVLGWPTDDAATANLIVAPQLGEPAAPEVAAVEETAARPTADAFPAAAAAGRTRARGRARARSGTRGRTDRVRRRAADARDAECARTVSRRRLHP